MLGRLARRVCTVPALGGEISIAFLGPTALAKAERWPKSRNEEEEDDVGDAASLNASGVLAKRAGEVGGRVKAGIGAEGVVVDTLEGRENVVAREGRGDAWFAPVDMSVSAT